MRMTFARVAAVGSLIAAVVVVGVLMFGGDEGTLYKVRVESAGQLVEGNNVQISGRPVGSVERIELTEDNQAELTIRVKDEFTPLHEGTTAVIRLQGLSGVANRYLTIHPGPNNAPELREGALLDIDKTTTIVDLDQLFNTLDPKTRRALQNVFQGFGTWFKDRGSELNDTFRWWSPATASFAEVVDQLARDQKLLTDFVVDTSRAVSAIAERRDDLANLVSNGNAFARGIARENVSLSQALGLLPSTLRQGTTTLASLRSALDDLDNLTNAAKPATKNLAPYLRELSRLFGTMRPTLRNLNLTVRRRGPRNDLTDLVRRFPTLARVAGRGFPRTIDALKKGQDQVEFIRPYSPDLAAWLSGFGKFTAYYDANGHYGRVLPVFNAFSYSSAGGGLLSPVEPSQRKDAVTDRGNDRRCPGAATQPAKDGSSPFTDGGKLDSSDCDPTQVPPGP